MAEEIKKSYNPFKMWGSWVGLILFPLMLILFSPENPFTQSFIKNLVELIIFIPIYMLIGFIIGWGIHSLIRRFKN